MWNQRKWLKGTKVRVLECLLNGGSKYLGDGKLLYNYDPSDDDTNIFTDEEIYKRSPTIILKNGRKIRGYECFWIPLEVLKEEACCI